MFPLPGNGPPQPSAPSSSPAIKEEGPELWPAGPDPDVPGSDWARSACSVGEMGLSDRGWELMGGLGRDLGREKDRK